MSIRVILAEKPAEAKAIAEGLKLKKGAGMYTGKTSIWPNDSVVLVNAVGHLLELAEPEDQDIKWKRDGFPSFEDQMKTFPIRPSSFKMRPSKGKTKQLQLIKKEFKAADIIVIATDPDREGENIGHTILEYSGIKENSKQLMRVWLQSLTPEGVVEAFSNLKPLKDTENLFLEARARQQGDWSYGMTMSRGVGALMASDNHLGSSAFPPKGTGGWSVGRVKTAVLTAVARREESINNWDYPKYWKITAKDSNGIEFTHKFMEEGKPQAKEFDDQQSAQSVLEKLSNKGNLKVTKTRKSGSALKLFDVNTLKKHMSETQGWSPKKTGDIYQTMYENGYLSYPRTDSAYISEKEFDYLLKTKDTVADSLGINVPLTNLAPNKKYVDSSKVTGHYANIFTEKVPSMSVLNPDEQKLYEAIARRTLAIFAPEWEYDETSVEIDNNGEIFTTQGITTISDGWKSVWPTKNKDKDLPEYENGIIDVTNSIVEGEKQPPKHYTEASLLAMMKKNGIGTPATWDNTLSTMLGNNPGYLKLAKNKKDVVLSDKGLLFYQKVGSLVDAKTTKQWEEQLNDIAAGNGKVSVDSFVDSVSKDAMDQLNDLAGKEV